MLKVIIKMGLVLGLLTVVGIIIPSSLTDPINDAFVWFLSLFNYLSPFLNVATLFACLTIAINFSIGVVMFYSLFWVLMHFN
jgi:hypothetical protein